MKSTVQFTKIRDVKSPNRAHATDAGTDFFIPEYSEQFFNDLRAKNTGNHLLYTMFIQEDGNEGMEITIPGGEQVNIPSGIRVNILDKDTYLDANNKSGVATKYHLVTGAKVVDADYQGEVHLNMMNVGNENVKIVTGQKIVQFIQKHYIDTQWEEITNEQYDALGVSERGTGGFASTGEK